MQPDAAACINCAGEQKAASPSYMHGRTDVAESMLHMLILANVLRK